MMASFVAKLVLFHLNNKKKVVNFSIFWFYIQSIYIWIVVHIYIYTIIVQIVLSWFLRYIIIQIAKSDVYTHEMSLQVRRLYQSYVCTSMTFAPVRCLYQCDVWTVQRLYRPTFSWVYQTQGSFFAKESSFHQFQCLTDIPMFGERILGLKEVITEPKLLYQRQIYSVCNFKGKGCTA